MALSLIADALFLKWGVTTRLRFQGLQACKKLGENSKGGKSSRFDYICPRSRPMPPPPQKAVILVHALWWACIWLMSLPVET